MKLCRVLAAVLSLTAPLVLGIPAAHAEQDAEITIRPASQMPRSPFRSRASAPAAESAKPTPPASSAAPAPVSDKASSRESAAAPKVREIRRRTSSVQSPGSRRPAGTGKVRQSSSDRSRRTDPKVARRARSRMAVAAPRTRPDTQGIDSRRVKRSAARPDRRLAASRSSKASGPGTGEATSRRSRKLASRAESDRVADRRKPRDRTARARTAIGHEKSTRRIAAAPTVKRELRNDPTPAPATEKAQRKSVMRAPARKAAIAEVASPAPPRLRGHGADDDAHTDAADSGEDSQRAERLVDEAAADLDDRALSLIDGGKLSAAEKLLRRGLSLQPRPRARRRLLFDLAWCSTLQGKSGSAAAYLKQAAALRTTSGAANKGKRDEPTSAVPKSNPASRELAMNTGRSTSRDRGARRVRRVSLIRDPASRPSTHRSAARRPPAQRRTSDRD